MDVFQQNWTERMKNDPWANNFLNNYHLWTEKESHDGGIKYRAVKKVENPNRNSKKGKYIIKTKGYKSKYTKQNFQKIKHFQDYFPFPGFDEAKVDKWYYYPKSARIKKPLDIITHYRTPEEPWSNTRPQSLYNLNYASLR